MSTEIRPGMYAAYWSNDSWDEAFETEQEAIEHAIKTWNLTAGDKVEVGQVATPEEPQIDGPEVFERLNDNLYQQAGDAAELWPGDTLSPAQIEELGKRLTEELMRFLREREAWPPNIFVVDSPREVEITHKQWESAFPELADEEELAL